MTAIRLEGCRSDSLLGYLKALGILRLVATQADTSARGSWGGSTFILETALSEEALERFFLESYTPTPILNPWNNGAGFDGKDDAAGQTMRTVAQTTSKRWAEYRKALAFIREHYVETGLRTQRYRLDAKDAKDREKFGFLRDLRANCPEQMLPWLDAVVLVKPGDLAFPYLFGSGGNDGRLDFSVNFASRVLDVCGDRPVAGSRTLLHDALRETAGARLSQDVAIGQFSSRHAGGANEANGFDAMSLVNPWDYVLMMEGALLFTGAIGRRTSSEWGRSIFPFALRSIPGGYGSASSDEQVRGELWLPVWDGRASLAAIVDLLRKGRMDMPASGANSVVQEAVSASDGATAAVTMGAALGICRLERTVFAQRNGLAFSGAAMGALKVSDRYDYGLAVISRRIAAWVDRVRRSSPGANAREALDAFYGTLLGFPNISLDGAVRVRARQELLVALADIDRAVAQTRGSDLSEMPWLDADIVQDLDDGSIEHRAALAIASIGAVARQDGGNEVKRENDELRVCGNNPAKTLQALIERRVRLNEKFRELGWLCPSCTLSADDAATFVTSFTEGSPQRERFGRLLRAYWHIKLGPAKLKLVAHDESLPAAYAVVKVVFDNPKARDDRIVRLLCAGDAARGLSLAVQRARAMSDLPVPGDNSRQAPRDVSAVVLDDPTWLAVSSVLPVEQSPEEYRKLINAALIAPIPWGERNRIATYLSTISTRRKDYAS